MLELLSSLYDWDTFRFTLWSFLDWLNLDTHAVDLIENQGYTVWEDHSISREAAS